MDEKLPGKTWLFDNAANDNMHHSARCHRAWADRLVGLIDGECTGCLLGFLVGCSKWFIEKNIKSS
jgi:hypothetical protein